jgi:hypothetical protein
MRVKASQSESDFGQQGCLGSFGEITMNAAGNNVPGGFAQVVVEELLELKKLRPKDLIHKGGRCAQHHCRMALAILAVGMEAMTPCQGKEELAFPGIWQAELVFDRRFGHCAELGIEPLESTGSGSHFTGKFAAAEQRFDFADFGNDFFTGHAWEDGPATENGSMRSRDIPAATS